MLKMVIFDFDGTIANTKSIAYDVYVQLAKEYGMEVLSKDEMRTLTKLSIRKRLKKHKVPLYRLPGLVKKSLPIYREKILQAPVYEGMRELIATLKKEGCLVAIVSSNHHDTIKTFLKGHNMDVFDEVHGGGSIFGKARAITRMIKRHHLKKHEVIYIGDELRDIKSCEKASVPIYVVTWGYDHKDLLQASNPKHLFDSVPELSQALLPK